MRSPATSPGSASSGTASGTSAANRRRAVSWRRGLAILTCFLLGGLLLNKAWAAEFDEYAVKAAYLYNFAKFVEWPPEAFASDDAPLWICIAGANPFGDALTMLSGKRVENHRWRYATCQR